MNGYNKVSPALKLLYSIFHPIALGLCLKVLLGRKLRSLSPPPGVRALQAVRHQTVCAGEVVVGLTVVG